MKIAWAHKHEPSYKPQLAYHSAMEYVKITLDQIACPETVQANIDSLTKLSSLLDVQYLLNYWRAIVPRLYKQKRTVTHAQSWLNVLIQTRWVNFDCNYITRVDISIVCHAATSFNAERAKLIQLNNEQLVIA